MGFLTCFVQSVAFTLIQSRAEIAFDPNVKPQKRCLETTIIANALPRGPLPASLFDTLWDKAVQAVTQLMQQEKPVPELLSSSIRILQHLKLSAQGVCPVNVVGLLHCISPLFAEGQGAAR